MEVEINNLGVLLAGVAAMVVGSVWYAKGVFGNKWAKLAKVDYDKQMQGSGWSPMVYMLILALIMAYVLAHVSYLAFTFFDVSYMYATISTGFWAWLGFMMPASFGNGVFEGRRKKLMAINAGNWLVTLIAMGWVLGLVGLPS